MISEAAFEAMALQNFELRERIKKLEADLSKAELRLNNVKWAWETVRDSPQATSDIREFALVQVARATYDWL